MGQEVTCHKINKIQEKQEKTAKLIGTLNLMLLPLYLVDRRVSLIVSIVVNLAAFRYLESLGKNRRFGANILTKADTFFSSSSRNPDSVELQNTYRNFINGGAAVYDEINTVFTPPK